MYPLLFFALILLPGSDSRIIDGDVSKGVIIGGRDTDISETPHLVALLYRNKQFCAGSILDEFSILTAAHCLKYATALKYFSIRCGSSYHNSGGKIHFVRSAIWHEKFGSSLDYDVGLIKLKVPINFTANAKPISLPEKEPEAGETVRIAGWGVTVVNGTSSEKLQSTEVDVVDAETCRKSYGKKLTPRMICAARPGKDACQGDSGGGMDYKGTVVGIISFGNGCALPGNPGVYTNVANPEILDFILKNLY